MKQNDSEQRSLISEESREEGLGQTGVEVSRMWVMAWTKDQWLQVRDVKS